LALNYQIEPLAQFDAAVYVPFCVFATLIVAQKTAPTATQISKALNYQIEPLAQFVVQVILAQYIVQLWWLPK
jgi:hypothetical protein